MLYGYSSIKTGIETPEKKIQAGEISPEQSTAIIVVHGMGQQTKFETLAMFAENLGVNYQNSAGYPKPPEYKIKLEQFDNESYLAYTDAAMKNSEGKETNIHIYESYWAPITEGKVKFYDVIFFLLTSCFWSIVRYFTQKGIFKRKVFDSVIKTKVGGYTIVLLVSSFIVTGFICYAVYLLTLIPEWFKGTVPLWKVGLYLLLFGAIYFLRSVIIQYVGDVCAYISPFKSFKFMEIRDSIQKTAYNVFKTVYSKKEKNKFYYDKVIIVSHSLGTVISYDVLNSLIRNDKLYGGESHEKNLKVSERTNTFITFGSPLDKIVYNFQNQQEKFALRDGILQTLQPLICSYDSRPAKWINIYSGLDVVSGKLDYYDDLSSNSKSVENIIDKECKIPFIAHVQYWEKKLLYKKVLENI